MDGFSLLDGFGIPNLHEPKTEIMTASLQKAEKSFPISKKSWIVAIHAVTISKQCRRPMMLSAEKMGGS